MLANVSTMVTFLVPENIDEAVRCAKIMGGMTTEKNIQTSFPIRQAVKGNEDWRRAEAAGATQEGSCS